VLTKAVYKLCEGAALRFIVDLTNSYAYYKPTDAEKECGTKHCKIMVPGRTVPTEEMVAVFNVTLSEALSTAGGAVAVHCTHGINRTGYFIVRYLMDVAGVTDVVEALKMFELARGERVNKDYLLKDLRLRYAPGAERIWGERIAEWV